MASTISKELKITRSQHADRWCNTQYSIGSPSVTFVTQRDKEDYLQRVLHAVMHDAQSQGMPLDSLEFYIGEELGRDLKELTHTLKVSTAVKAERRCEYFTLPAAVTGALIGLVGGYLASSYIVNEMTKSAHESAPYFLMPFVSAINIGLVSLGSLAGMFASKCSGILAGCALYHVTGGKKIDKRTNEYKEILNSLETRCIK